MNGLSYNMSFFPGMGYADVENEVPCTPLSVMRIASISKSITMTVLARLWQEGAVNLDKPIQEYIPQYPVHWIDGEKVSVLCNSKSGGCILGNSIGYYPCFFWVFFTD